MKKIVTILAGLIPLNFLKIFLLRLIGHNVSYKSFIGFSFLNVKHISLEENSKIGNLNYININELILEDNSFIGSINYLKGDFKVHLSNLSGISRQNKIRRSYPPVVYGKATFFLGKNSFIVSNHFLDVTRSIIIGENSILAGIGSQIWTHGYYHANEGSDRIRIDGEIYIGNNVYVGSGCIFNPGIQIKDAIHIGAGSVISKNLDKQGMYVNQGLRFIENDIEKIVLRLKKIEGFNLSEEVYQKE